MAMFNVDNLNKNVGEIWKALDGKEAGWKQGGLISGICENPMNTVMGACCPCILAGKISEHHGRSCLGSALCFVCGFGFHTCLFDFQDRKELAAQAGANESDLATLCLVTGCSMCTRIQSFNQIGGDAADFNSLKPKQETMA